MSCDRIVMAIASLLVVAACGDAAHAGLMNYWSFDSDGTDAVGSNDGTLRNGAAISNSSGGYAIGSGAVSLDGVNDDVLMAATAIGSHMGNVSISMWFKSTNPVGTTNASLAVLYWDGAPSAQGSYARIDNRTSANPKLIKGSFGNPATPPELYSQTNSPFVDGQWHQLTVTGASPGVGKGTAYVNVYVDGIQFASSGNGYSTATLLLGGTASFRVGSRGDGVFCLKGGIDDVGVWDAAMTSAEAKALYSLGSNASLGYGAADAQVLFNAFSNHTSGVTSDGKTWGYATGLMGNEGQVVNNGAALVLDATSGFGVKVVPEPGSLAILAAGLFGLICYAWRKRK